jgi:mannose-6-phosphate isomerase-like protein (cupin superfamily)
LRLRRGIRKPYTDPRHRLGIVPTDDHTAVELLQFEHTVEFEGEAHGTSVSFILVDMPPGEGVSLHTHPYVEIFIVQEGHARYTVGNETIDVVAPRTLIGPANVPHGFTNVGDVRLKQVDIHLSPKFVTEWL